jgi:hypothetical protein
LKNVDTLSVTALGNHSTFMSFGCHMFTYWSSPTTSNSKRSLTQRTESRMFIYSSLQKFKLFQQKMAVFWVVAPYSLVEVSATSLFS